MLIPRYVTIDSGHKSLTSQIHGILNFFAIFIPATKVKGCTLEARIISGFPYLFAYCFVVGNRFL